MVPRGLPTLSGDFDVNNTFNPPLNLMRLRWPDDPPLLPPLSVRTSLGIGGQP